MLNHGTKLENNKETPSWKFSTQEGLALVAALSQQDETQTNTNWLISDVLQSYFFFKYFFSWILFVLWYTFFADWRGIGMVNRYLIGLTSFALHWPIIACSVQDPEGLARRVPLSGIRFNKEKENQKLKYLKAEKNLSLSILKNLLSK